MTKVFVTNRSFNDFSDAARYGELIFLTSGEVSRFETNQLTREIHKQMKGAQPEDWILITSLPVICAIASSLFALRFQRLNLLIWDVKTKTYAPRHIAFLHGNVGANV